MKENLHNWIFHYNIYTKQWQATTRDNYGLLFNGSTNEKVLRSSDINTLIWIIKRTSGDKKRIEKILN